MFSDTSTLKTFPLRGSVANELSTVWPSRSVRLNSDRNCRTIGSGNWPDVCEVAPGSTGTGIRFKRHKDCFASGSTPDTELLKKVGKHKWILITADQKQRTRTLESELIKQFKIREFVFTSNEVGDVGELLVKASRRMRNLCRNHEGPFVASISKSANVAIRTL